MDYNQRLIKFLNDLDIRDYFGVNGGGLIQFLKYIPPSTLSNENDPRFFNLSEYAAGYAPLGYYLSTGKIAACVATTGAAQRLISNGISDARFMSIPAVYIMALSSESSIDTYPIQDVSRHGMNIISGFTQEFHDDVYVFDSQESHFDLFDGIHQTLVESRPAVIFFRPEALCQSSEDTYHFSKRSIPSCADPQLNELILSLNSLSDNSRVLVFCCSEASVTHLDSDLFKSFIRKINADVIYTVNGDNTATLTEDKNLGHIMLGANDAAHAAWEDINSNDLLICLGVDVGEYAINMRHFPHVQAYSLTQYTASYGQVNGSYNHLFDSKITQITGSISKTLERFLDLTKLITFNSHVKFDNPSDNLPNHQFANKKDHINLIEFYKQLDNLFLPNSIAFEDVCIAYRDRQAILKLPNKNAHFYTSNHGSAMGGAFGMAVGSAIADPESKVFLFSGDGCFRLYGGNLAEARKLNITLFIMNNNELSIIHDGCNHIVNNDKKFHYHEYLVPIDWVNVAIGFGWRGVSLLPDLSNLSDIMQMSYDESPISILVNVPIDCTQVVGKNFRYDSLVPFPNL